MIELNTIYPLDFRDGGELIPNKSIDLIVTDPPYNIKKAAWDNIKDYDGFMHTLFSESERVLKDSGSFYWFHNDMQVIARFMEWIRQNTGFVFKQMITWNKIDPSFDNIGFVQQRLSIDGMRNYYNGFTEYILFYTFQDETGLATIKKDHINKAHPFAKIIKEARLKAGLSTIQVAEMGGFYGKVNHGGSVANWENGFNTPSFEQYKKLREILPIESSYKNLSDQYKDLRREYEDLRYTFNTQRTADDLRCNSNDWHYPPAESNGHATPKPREMIKNIVRHSSNEGDTVLDWFMGSGTTARACEDLGRNYVGFEKNTPKEIPQMRLALP